jgi:hypothetical protein
MITQEVKAGRCACEVKNPAGSCCLGDVARVLQAAVTELKTNARRERRKIDEA